MKSLLPKAVAGNRHSVLCGSGGILTQFRRNSAQTTGSTSVFGSEGLTGALQDRLTHGADTLEKNGDSYRLGRSRKHAAFQPPNVSEDPLVPPDYFLPLHDACWYRPMYDIPTQQRGRVPEPYWASTLNVIAHRVHRTRLDYDDMRGGRAFAKEAYCTPCGCPSLMRSCSIRRSLGPMGNRTGSETSARGTVASERAGGNDGGA